MAYNLSQSTLNGWTSEYPPNSQVLQTDTFEVWRQKTNLIYGHIAYLGQYTDTELNLVRGNVTTLTNNAALYVTVSTIQTISGPKTFSNSAGIKLDYSNNNATLSVIATNTLSTTNFNVTTKLSLGNTSSLNLAFDSTNGLVLKNNTTTVLAAASTGISVTGTIAATGAISSLSLTAAAITSTGAISGTTLTGTSLVLGSGAIGSGAITSTGAISGTTLTGTSLVLGSGAIGSGAITSTGAISGASLVSSGRLDAIGVHSTSIYSTSIYSTDISIDNSADISKNLTANNIVKLGKYPYGTNLFALTITPSLLSSESAKLDIDAVTIVNKRITAVDSLYTYGNFQINEDSNINDLSTLHYLRASKSIVSANPKSHTISIYANIRADVLTIGNSSSTIRDTTGSGEFLVLATTPTFYTSIKFDTSGPGNVILQAPPLDSDIFITLPSKTGTLLTNTNTAVFTNKKFDTAGAGNVLNINGTQITGTTGTGSAVVLSVNPGISTPTISSPTITGSIKFDTIGTGDVTLQVPSLASNITILLPSTSGTLITSQEVAAMVSGVTAGDGIGTAITPAGGTMITSATTTGSTTVIVLATSPAIITPTIKGNTIFGYTSASNSNTATLALPSTLANSVTITLPSSTGTLVTDDNTVAFTNKSFNASVGNNIFQIVNNTISAVTGTGSSVVLATSPAIITPTIKGNTIFGYTSASSNTATLALPSTLANSVTITLPSSTGTLVTAAEVDAKINTHINAHVATGGGGTRILDTAGTMIAQGTITGGPSVDGQVNSCTFVLAQNPTINLLTAYGLTVMNPTSSGNPEPGYITFDSGNQTYGTGGGSTILRSFQNIGSSNIFITLPSKTGTLLTDTSIATFTNKKFDTAGAGNVLNINGTRISGTTGTGNAVVLSTDPTIRGLIISNDPTWSGAAWEGDRRNYIAFASGTGTKHFVIRANGLSLTENNVDITLPGATGTLITDRDLDARLIGIGGGSGGISAATVSSMITAAINTHTSTHVATGGTLKSTTGTSEVVVLQTSPTIIASNLTGNTFLTGELIIKQSATVKETLGKSQWLATSSLSSIHLPADPTSILNVNTGELAIYSVPSTYLTADPAGSGKMGYSSPWQPASPSLRLTHVSGTLVFSNVDKTNTFSGIDLRGNLTINDSSGIANNTSHYLRAHKDPTSNNPPKHTIDIYANIKADSISVVNSNGVTVASMDNTGLITGRLKRNIVTNSTIELFGLCSIEEGDSSGYPDNHYYNNDDHQGHGDGPQRLLVAAPKFNLNTNSIEEFINHITWAGRYNPPSYNAYYSTTSLGQTNDMTLHTIGTPSPTVVTGGKVNAGVAYAATGLSYGVAHSMAVTTEILNSYMSDEMKQKLTGDSSTWGYGTDMVLPLRTSITVKAGSKIAVTVQILGSPAYHGYKFVLYRTFTHEKTTWVVECSAVNNSGGRVYSQCNWGSNIVSASFNSSTGKLDSSITGTIHYAYPAIGSAAMGNSYRNAYPLMTNDGGSHDYTQSHYGFIEDAPYQAPGLGDYYLYNTDTKKSDFHAGPSVPYPTNINEKDLTFTYHIRMISRARYGRFYMNCPYNGNNYYSEGVSSITLEEIPA